MSRLRRVPAIPNVKGVEDLKVIPTPIPPIAEQFEVLEKLKEQLGHIQRIEEAVNEAKAAVDHLDQSILAKAFRGELVPQDPNDEPASVLLNRIREQRAPQAKTTTRKTTKTPRSSKMAKKASKSTSRRHPLAEVLAARGQQMAPTQLLAEAGYNEESIEDFYAALRKEIHQGLIHELRPSESDVILEAITP